MSKSRMFERHRQAQSGPPTIKAKTAEMTPPPAPMPDATSVSPVPVGDVTDAGRYVTLVQTTNNRLKLIPDQAAIAEFVEDNEHHLPTSALEALGLFANPDRKSNLIWSDDTVLYELLEDHLTNGWQQLDPADIGALTSAPILEAPDGRVYWHERYQIEAAGEELLLGKEVKFDGAPENQVLNQVPPKAASKTAEEVAPAPEDVAPVAPTPLNSAGGKYKYWTAEALSACIEALSKISDFANDKAAQEAVAGMADELNSRPKQIEEPKAASKKRAGGSYVPTVNQETSKVLEGDKSIPDGRDKVEDNTRIKRPETTLPEKLANLPPIDQDAGKVLEGERSVDPTVTGMEDHSGVERPATKTPLSLAPGKRGSVSIPAIDPEAGKVLEGDKSCDPTVTGVEDHSGIKRPATVLPSKLAAQIDPKYIEAAQRAIEDEDEVCYDVAANANQIFGNVKHMKWFVLAVAEELANLDPHAEEPTTFDEDEFGAEDPDAVADHMASAKTATIEHRPGHKNSKGEEAPWCNVKDGKVLDSHASKEEAEKALRDHEYFKGAAAKTATIEHRPGHKDSEGKEAPWCNVKDGKVLDSHQTKEEAEKALRDHEYFKGASAKTAAEISVEKAIKLAESAADKLKALYLEVKPVAVVNGTRPVRDAVESVYQSMDLFQQAIKVLTKQKQQEEDEAAAQAAALPKKKSSLLGGLMLAAAE